MIRKGWKWPSKKELKEKSFVELFGGMLECKKGQSAMDILREAGLRR